MKRNSFEERSINLFKNILQINTTNELKNEKEAAIFIQETLDSEGIDSEIIYSPNGRANLIAKLSGHGQKKEPLVLLSHLDVVHPGREKWRNPPFSGVIEEEVIWGRGTLDTKQLTIMHLMAFLRLKNESINRDVYFIASADEENGSTEGMRYLAETRPDIFHHATVLSEGGGFTLEGNDEKVFMLFGSGEKGSAQVLVTAIGDSGHAGSPPNNQALKKISEVINYLIRRPFETKEYTVKDIFTDALRKNKMQYFKTTTEDNEQEGNLANNLSIHMDVPTLSIDYVDIGEQINVIPYKAEASLEFRTLPHQTEVEFKAMLHELLSNFQVEWKVINFQQGYESNYQSKIIKLFIEKSNALGFNYKWIPFIVLGKTDGRFISKLSNNIYGMSPVCTPFTQVLNRVHNKDEHIEVNSFLFGVRLMTDVVQEYCIQ